MRKHRVDGLLDVRIKMHRVDELNLGVAQGQLGDGQADTLKAMPEVFPAMAGDQHHALVIAQSRQRRADCRFPVAALEVFAHPQQGIDDRIAGHFDLLQHDPFAQQVIAGLLGRGEMQVGDDRGQTTIGFLGPGRLEVSGTQAGLDMGNGDMAVEGAECSDEAGGGVAVNKDDIRVHPLVVKVELTQQLLG